MEETFYIMGILFRLLNRFIYSRFGKRVGRIVSGSVLAVLGLLFTLAGGSSALIIGIIFLLAGVGFIIWGFLTPKGGAMGMGNFSISSPGQSQYPQYPQQPYGQPQYSQQPNQPYGQSQYPSYPPQSSGQSYGQPQYPPYPQQPSNPYNTPQYPQYPPQQ
jgi:hypothetical protein